jgi:hypothetical protein
MGRRCGSAAQSTAVRVGGHAEDVHVTGADFHHEEAIQALKRHRAVNVEEIDG